MSWLTALALGAATKGLAPVVGAPLAVRSPARTAAATRDGLIGRPDPAPAPAPAHLQLAGTARASEATGARPRLVAAADPSPHF